MNGSLWRVIGMRFLALVVMVAVGAAGFAIWQEQLRARRIATEIDTLRHEADEIERDNQSLTEKIAYFHSPDFEEREAKDKLGLRRLDESVVSLQGVPTREAEALPVPAPNQASASLSVAVPNYQKWWQHFFSPSPERMRYE